MKTRKSFVIAGLIFFNYFAAFGSFFYRGGWELLTWGILLLHLFSATLNVAIVHCIYTLLKQKYKFFQVFVLWGGVMFALYFLYKLFA